MIQLRSVSANHILSGNRLDSEGRIDLLDTENSGNERNERECSRSDARQKIRVAFPKPMFKRWESISRVCKYTANQRSAEISSQ